MSNRPWFPVWVADHLAETTDLEADQHGIYFVLLCLTWRRPDCALPNDMVWLKRALSAYISNLHGHQFNRIVPPLLERFFELREDGKFYNLQLEKQAQKIDKTSVNARQRVAKRWGETNKNKNLADTTVIQIQSQSHKEKEKAKSDGFALPPDGGSPSQKEGLHEEKVKALHDAMIEKLKNQRQPSSPKRWKMGDPDPEPTDEEIEELKAVGAKFH